MTIRELCTNVLLELNVYQPGETPSAADLQTVLNKLNRLLNNWNAERCAVYASAFASYTLVPSLSPHTIGPTGTWVVTQRPVSIDGARLILNLSTPEIHTPIRLRDAQWWNDQATPGLTSTFPTDLYYQPDWPNGSLFFWPVPQGAYQVQLQTRVLLDVVALDDVFSLPPGYEDAITLSVAETTAIPFSRPLDPNLVNEARRARGRIFANNDVTPRLRTADGGMSGPPTSGRRADFNYRTGSIT